MSPTGTPATADPAVSPQRLDPLPPASTPAPHAPPVEADRDAPRCVVCGGSGHDWRDISTCSHCERTFHLHIQRQDAADDDCGAVVVGAACGWSPICNDCLDRIDADAAVQGHPERLRPR